MTPAETNMAGSATQVVFALLHPFLVSLLKTPIIISLCSFCLRLIIVIVTVALDERRLHV